MILRNLWSLWLKRSKLYKYRSQFKVLFWLALMVSYIAAVVPQEIAPHIGNLNDKAHHILAFIVLGILLRLSYRVHYWIALLLLIAYGGFIEVSQLFSISRSSDWADIAADTIGSFIGLKLYKYLRRVI